MAAMAACIKGPDSTAIPSCQQIQMQVFVNFFSGFELILNILNQENLNFKAKYVKIYYT